MYVKNLLFNLFKERQQKWIFGASFLLFFVAIYILNILYPVFADDWVYSLFYELRPHRLMERPTDLFLSQYNHYMLWGGRTVAHTIAQLLLLLPVWLHDIINAAAFLVFLVVAYRIANIFDNKINGILFLIMGCLIWLFTDSMLFSSAIWITGSANYLWTSLFVILFMYPFIKYMIQDQTSDLGSKSMNLVMFVGGLVCGWTNENTSIALLFFLFVFFIVCKKSRKQIPLWAILGAATTLIGCLLLLLAPGNFARLEEELIDPQMPQSGLDLLFYKLFDFWKTIKITYTFHLTLLYLITLVIYVCMNKDWMSDSKKCRSVYLSILLVAVAYISAAAMMAAPMISYRTLFFTNVVLVISLSLLFAEFYRQKTWTKLAFVSFAILLLLVSSYDYSKKYTTMKFVYFLWKERDQYIVDQKANNNLDIVFPTYFTLHPKFLINDMKSDPHDSRNHFYSIYKGVNSIRSDSTAIRLQTP